MLDPEEEIHGEIVESDGLLGQPREGILHVYDGNKGIFRILFFLSIALNVFFAEFGLAHWILSRQKTAPSYENGFASDLGHVKPEIELTEYVFTGGVGIDEHGDYVTDPRSQEYVGTPSPEVDEAWDTLLAGLNVNLDVSDPSMSDGAFKWPGSGKYFTGLEVFHSLHCLNRLRQALYPDYYHVFNDADNPSRVDHIGHCINHLRQAIQCHSDLTPMEWNLVGNKVILNTATRHTCRDFEKIHDWARQRRATLENREDIEGVKNGSLFIVD